MTVREKTIGDVIADLRKTKRIPQYKMAADAGIH